MTRNISKPDSIKRLTTLHGQVGPGSSYSNDSITSWKMEVSSVLSELLEHDDKRIRQFNKIPFYSTEDYRVNLQAARELVWEVLETEKARIKTVEREPLIFDDTFIHPELWLHLKSSFEDEAWDRIPGITAVFVEHWMRNWSSKPRGNNGRKLLGENLFGSLLGGDGEYRLGDPQEPGELSGWGHLGLGFALALSNVDRHNLSDRQDKKAYALGVVGLGSLLLTQMNHQHGHIPKHKRPKIGWRPWTEEEILQSKQ